TTFAGGSGFNLITQVANDGSFAWNNVPSGRYYLGIAGDIGQNNGWFLKSVVSDGRDITESGININGGQVILEALASPNGARIDGVALDTKGQPIANALIVAAPPLHLRSRTDLYRKILADQNGQFAFKGVAPGDYSLFAW